MKQYDKNDNDNGRLLLGMASLVAVVATAATVWAFMRRRDAGGTRPGPGVPGDDPAQAEEAWRAQTMSGSSQ